MELLIYDGTFQGFLSAVFCVYEYKLSEVEIHRAIPSSTLFGNVRHIETDEAKAERVWKGLATKVSAAGLHTLYCSYCADTLQEENNMLSYIRHALNAMHNIEKDYSNHAVLRAQRVEKMVHRERHRMTAFIRFRLTKDNIYFAEVQPDFDVLPLIKKHFKNRYADQHWLIYDTKRNYGIYYNLDTVEEITLNFSEQAKNEGDWVAEDEPLYQTLWQQYFKSVNIVSRKNMKLHIQHMPKRYWKLLTEKHIIGKELK